MTRLSAFAARVTREMLRVYWEQGKEAEQWPRDAARAVLERELRAFVKRYADEVADVLEGDYARWLDAPEPETIPTQK